MFWSDLDSKLIFMLSRMAHSKYLYCLIDVIHNDFKLADQKKGFLMVMNSLTLLYLTTSPEVKFKHDIEFINVAK